ncbi:hypothetical protein LCGC14_3019430, partial [marine sediment metagenome]
MKPELIHSTRIPHHRQKGYYVRGWTPGAGDIRKLHRPPFNPETDCGACQGRHFVLDDEVNKHRSHYMRWKQ